MNRKLKKLLKNTYASQYPDRKTEFIRELKSEPVWRKLHPISSFFGTSPTLIPLSAAMSAAAICVLIMLFAFHGDRSPLPDPPPDIISQMTVTTSQSAETSVTDDRETVAVTDITVTTEKTDALQETAHTAAVIQSDIENETVWTLPAATSDIQTDTSITTTAVTSASVTTSVYYTELFSHEFINESINADNTLIYGYPDSYIFDDMIKSQLGDFYDLTSREDITDLFKSLILWYKPNIVEGDTVGLEYIAYEGKPWTICEVEISKVYNFVLGNDNKVINKGDRIKIAMPGGYMTVSDYISLNPNDTQFDGWTEEQIASTIIYEAGSNQHEPKIGDHYGYFLDTADLDIPADDLYIREWMCDISQFTTDRDFFVSCNEYHTDFKFKKDTLTDSLWEYFYDSDSGRGIAFHDEGSLFHGAFSCYSIDDNGRLTYLDLISIPDPFFPFTEPYGEEEVSVHYGKAETGHHYILTWTDSGVILKYHTTYISSASDEFETITFTIPK